MNEVPPYEMPDWVAGVGLSIVVVGVMVCVAWPWLVALYKRCGEDHAQRAAILLALLVVLVVIWNVAGLRYAWLILLVSLIVKTIPLVLGVIAVWIAYQALREWKLHLRGREEHQRSKDEE